MEEEESYGQPKGWMAVKRRSGEVSTSCKEDGGVLGSGLAPGSPDMNEFMKVAAEAGGENGVTGMLCTYMCLQIHQHSSFSLVWCWEPAGTTKLRVRAACSVHVLLWK